MTDQWVCTRTGYYVHVMPIDDERPHKPSGDCPCQPKALPQDPAVIVHPAWDRREVLEELKEKP